MDGFQSIFGCVLGLAKVIDVSGDLPISTSSSLLVLTTGRSSVLTLTADWVQPASGSVVKFAFGGEAPEVIFKSGR